MTNFLAQNLKALMWKWPITETALSREVSISQPVINRMLKGITTNPNVETLRPIAKFFNVSIEQLIGDELLLSTHEKNRDESPTSNTDWADIPIFNWEMVNQLPADNMRKDRVLRLHNKLSNDAYALTVEDITMEPTFLKGTIIVIEPNLEPIDQDYVILLLKGQKKAIFRQILFSGDDIFFKSLNKEFGTVQLSQNFKILGVVVQAHLYFRKQRKL